MKKRPFFFANDLLRTLVSAFPGVQPNRDEVEHRLLESSSYKKQLYDTGRFCSLYTEFCVHVALETLCAHYSERVIFCPIPPKAQTLNYCFDYYDGELRISEKTTKKTYAGIDELLLVDRLPVVFEVKIVGEEVKDLGLRYTARPGIIKRKIHPIQEYFGQKECGYVFVLLPEIVNDPIFAEAKRCGALVTEHCMNGSEFSREIRKIAGKHNLTLSDKLPSFYGMLYERRDANARLMNRIEFPHNISLKLEES